MDKKIIKVIQKDNDLFNLTWVINNICNNRCSYCVPDLNSGIGHHYSWENAEKFLDKLFELHPKIHCSISGGEPTLSPFLPDLVKKFNKSGNTIGLTSNGIKSTKYWENISKYLYYACFSYHPEFPVKDFKQKVIVSSLNTFVTVRIMMLPSMWNHCVEVFNSFYDIPTIFIEPVRILDFGGENRGAHIYSEDQLEWFKNTENMNGHKKSMNHLMEKHKPVEIDSYYEFSDGITLSGSEANSVNFVNAGLTNFEGYTCEVGLKSLFVLYDGKIKRGNCMVGGFIGEIGDVENIHWPIDPVTCTDKICHCASDIAINKWISSYNEYINGGVYADSYLELLK
jgi:hypothetical protein